MICRWKYIQNPEKWQMKAEYFTERMEEQIWKKLSELLEA